MKNTILLLAFVVFILPILHSQNFNKIPKGGEVKIKKQTTSCLSTSQRNVIKNQIKENIQLLKKEGNLKSNIKQSGGHPLFIWPVTQADGFNYNSVWALINYVDHNPAYPGLITDYNCGTRSYDTNSGYNHQGFDISNWPFWWKQMDNNQAIAVAAADGQIIAKNDGSYDRNCSFNNDTPNYIILQHDDGSESWYLHFKNGGLTSKNVGESVTTGEFLGVLGSSGSSTAPHLHFEVYDTNDNLIDPSQGSCNDFNNETWWVNQKPYNNPNINAALTHSSPPEFYGCPVSEVTNESDQFNPGDLVTFAVYLRDQEAGTTMYLKIIKPDNTTLYEWDFNLTDDFLTSYWYWQYNLTDQGLWKWEATYQGETVSHPFNVGVLGTEDNSLTNTIVYPNPVEDQLIIKTEQPIKKVTIKDLLGRTILENNSPITSSMELNTNSLNKGLYFVRLTSITNKTKTIKLIKN